MVMQRFRVLAAVLAAVLAFAAVPVARACGEELLKQNFNEYGGKVRDYTKNMAKGDFSGLSGLSNDNRVNVGKGGMEVEHPKGCWGTKKCGVQFDSDFKCQNEATLSYRVKFEKGYNFNKGGKLPGLCDKDCPSGCVRVGKKGGFSARVMWREDGELESYSYFPNKKKSCGESWLWGMKAKADKWYTITMHVKLNDPGKDNGKQTVVVKEEGGRTKRFDRKGIKWRYTEKRKICRFTFRNFHGGSGGSWASKKHQSIFFDDIHVRKGNCVDQMGSGSGSSDIGGEANSEKFVEEDEDELKDIPDDEEDDSEKRKQDDEETGGKKQKKNRKQVEQRDSNGADGDTEEEEETGGDKQDNGDSDNTVPDEDDVDDDDDDLANMFYYYYDS